MVAKAQLESLIIARNIPFRSRKLKEAILSEPIPPIYDFPDTFVNTDIEGFKDFLNKFGYSLQGNMSDLENNMKHGDVIEVYNINGELMYANSHYFRKTSQHLTCQVQSWKKLFKRPASLVMKATVLSLKILASSSKEPMNLSKALGPHTIEETGGLKLKIRHHAKLGWRLNDKNGLPIGIIILTEAKLV